MDYVNKLEQFKNLSLLKQSAIAIAVVGAIIALLSNYSNIKKTVGELTDKYQENESVKEFITDVTKVIKPVLDKIESFFHAEEKKGE